ncbi:hypothetical protein MKQ70_16050 [Chitinophaga sedimenti]|uniref:hypothetical protein n=1 Tax=Chitinophaga sedimenti TaxID=2033606 RepID=UPI002004CFE2|nr:hypothetical protein [Chitinophaga sedimenti]MCK7556446.1 hypothetical protein [Chitinophaga sedimenti]
MADTLKHKIQSAQPGLVFYSLTPPKITTEATKIVTIAEAQVGRLQHLAIDGLILYDIQDESMRTDKERPFSFIPTLAPEHYGRISLADLPAPKIIYKSIANQTRESFGNWLQQNEDLEYMVFVGASSKQQVESTNFSLADAYQLRKDRHPDLLLGGVTIPERHTKKGDEHRRIFDKMKNGCSFLCRSVYTTLTIPKTCYRTTITKTRAHSRRSYSPLPPAVP